ncbi:MAG: hypothetical protein RL172_2386 [Bacteroidota bacterium]|jgi:hypothetical protein
MNTLFRTDEPRVTLYLHENASWMATIHHQAQEIPVLEKLLVQNEAAITDDKSKEERHHFCNAFSRQQQQMNLLNTELKQQQQRLTKDAAAKALYDIDALCSQDILRDRIQEIEKRYVELKCSFMKFLSGII